MANESSVDVAQKDSASGKILRNSFWYGLETLLETVVTLGTSVLVANYLGPEKLGYFQYINFFVQAVTRAGGTGLANATRKYMSDFLAVNRPGAARAVYALAFRYQLLGTLVVTALGLGAVLLFADPGNRAMAVILMLSILPGVMSWVPAQANLAFEDFRPNTTSALGYLVSYVVVIALTLHFHWDLVGVASALMVGRTVEVVLRTIPLQRKLRAFTPEPLEQELHLRIRRFVFQAMGLQLLTSIVWDRSELIFLKYFSDLKQIAFYSISFTLSGNLLTAPRTFVGATGTTLMVEAARDPSRVRSIVGNASRFLFLVVFPVNLGAAAITAQIIGFAYSAKFLPAIPVMIVASILIIPRAFQEIPETLLRTADRQDRIIVWYGITSVVNVVLDLLFIPRLGAVGAAWGNGLAQAFGVWMLWREARRHYDFELPVSAAIRLGLAGTGMAVFAYFVANSVKGLPGVILAIVAAVPVYVLLVRVFGGLQAADRERLGPIGNRLPAGVRKAYLSVVNFAAPGQV